ncbi:polyhydroxyalkanoate depolymerase [Ideonella paludis]|uniref:Polyhydroxyalkanoate depolymerase n=1 Tax=Ideonella paludis TaxID=1233411 RepID=A0ABS5E058_9BURK|nr:polyhydroxyalkanoate depolymerase [Ideonella paludis]MBQ0936792.1 polyhydroxyalkanoate depolymerase [Ideonella paludis]
MLYQLYETQRALMAPFSEFASASAKLYSHPLSPFTHTPMAQRVSAGLDLMHRLAKDYEKPEFGIKTVKVNGTEVAVQEQVAIHKPFCRLIRFKRFTDETAALATMKNQPKVLLVAPLSGHHSTLLRDTVRSLLQDHKVYITDWTDARMVPTEVGPFHLNDYVRYVQEFIRHIGPEVNVISVCQPTVPVLAAISLLATHGEFTPRTMTMMGGPIDARKSPTAVNNLAMNKSHSWFENNVIYRVPPNFPGAGRAVYPGFLQHTGFVAMNPDRHLSSHYDYFLDLIRGDDDSAESHREFYDEYNAVLDMPAEYYLETIKAVFQDFALVNGTWEVDGTFVRPQDIKTTALLTVEGELDDISGAGQTKAAHDLCTGIPSERQFHYDVAGAGHYGIFSGRRWREKVYPEVRAFIAANHPKAVEPTPAPAPAAEPVAHIPAVAAPAPTPATSAAPKAPAAARKPAAKAATPAAKPKQKPAVKAAAPAPQPEPVVKAAAPARKAAPRKTRG